ncbi:MAG: c-type cytochrome [Planctomycetes bacterium]|nr:c-type cytochrome [Planctomycetota bacterium]
MFQRTPVVRRVMLSLGLVVLFASASFAQLKFQKGDHISIIGNTLADRMQHDGYMEAAIQSRMPELELSFRNLGYPADELTVRPRSDNFGSPDEWLTRTQADIVFAFFGFNESFAGEAGLPGFRKNLENFIDHTLSQKYNGKSAPRLVLFSPIACEDMHDRLLPDGKENNARIALYAQAMAEVAKAKNVTFVDLYEPTLKLYAAASSPLTINGIHLNPHGNELLADVIVAQLLPGMKSKLSDPQAAKLREAVVDKDYYWFSRYRVIDEYNVFGGRSRLSWNGQSNADVMSREMEIFDVMTANRDKRVWAVANGSDLTVNDSNAPPELVVKSNRPGPNPDGTYPYLSGEEAIKKMKIAKGLKVNLFASEEKFPDLINPVQMAVDTNSRLWVATWPSYPHWNPTHPREDKLIILVDDDHDGKADREIVFADHLNSPTGFEFWGGGVIVAQAPELWFLKDTDGDDKADVRIRLVQGISSADSHHTCNSFVIGPDGGLYYSHGVFHFDNQETPTGPFRAHEDGVFRFDPRTFQTTHQFPIGPNPHGNTFDQWGHEFATDGTTGVGYYVGIGKGTGAPHQFYTKRMRPVPGSAFLSSSQFPDDMQGNFLVCNVIGFQGVMQHTVTYNGADITAKEIEPIVVSEDPNFRPSDIEVGGDGGLYISDWHNPLIGHMQHNIRDPNRDHTHGRIYRFIADGRPLLEPAQMKGKPIAEVLGHFFAKENGTRYRARLELSGRDVKDIVPAVKTFTDKLDVKKADDAQALLESLWVLEEQRVVDGDLLRKVYGATNPLVRAAAIRTLGHWGTAVPDGAALLLDGARDESAAVRAEAVIAATSFDGLDGAEAIFEVATRPTDPQLDYNLNWARGKINVDQVVQDALKSGKPLSKAAQTYAVQKAGVATLLTMKRTDVVNDALLSREGIPAANRTEALDAMAQAHHTTQMQELIGAIGRADAASSPSLSDLLAMLAAADAEAIKANAEALTALADKATAPSTQRTVYAAWMNADGNADRAFAQASKSTANLKTLLEAAGEVHNPLALESLYPHARALIFALPEGLKADQTAGSDQMSVKFYAPARRTADAAVYEASAAQATGKVQQFQMDQAPLATHDDFALVFDGTINIPRTGKYTFFINSDDGSRLYLDHAELINNDGLHGMVEKSATVELAAGPHPIGVCYFDNGGGDGLVVSWQGPGINKQEIPAAVLSGAGENIHDTALRVVAGIPNHMPEKVADCAKLIASGEHVEAALAALARVHPTQVKASLTADQMQAIAGVLVKQASQASAVVRDSADYGTLITLGETLTAAQPADAPLKKEVAALRASIPMKVDAALMEKGKEIYFREAHCGTCHQPDGRGLVGQYPPLDGSPWINGSPDRLARIALHGLWGKITVEGKTFQSPPLPPMTPFRDLLKDDELAAVLTYVRNSWSNRAGPVEVKTVTDARAATKDRSMFWTADELLKDYPMEKTK